MMIDEKRKIKIQKEKQKVKREREKKNEQERKSRCPRMRTSLHARFVTFVPKMTRVALNALSGKIFFFFV